MSEWLKKQLYFGLFLFSLTSLETDSSVMVKTISVLFPTECLAKGANSTCSLHVKWVNISLNQRVALEGNLKFIQRFCFMEKVFIDELWGGEIIRTGNYWESWDYNLVLSKCFLLSSIQSPSPIRPYLVFTPTWINTTLNPMLLTSLKPI